MAKNLNVNLSFTADTGQAKTQIQSLQNQLTELINSTSKSKNFALEKEIQNSTEAAIRLKNQLESATNVKTGNLNLTKFSQELNKSGMSLKDYKIALENLGPQGSETFSKLAQAITTAEMPIANMNSKLSEFATTLKNTARWQISSSIMHGFMGTLQSAYNYAQNLNRSLNDIRIVTGQSTEQMAEFAERANKAAKELSTTTTAYTNASLIYYQQGLNDEEVEARTNTTIKMANVTGENATAVSDYMTAIWNNFDDGSKSIEHYADVITALGAATASSSEEIAGGLEKFAAIANTVGMSYEYATTALATIVAQTRQSEDTVGTGLRTILSRFSNVTLGETLEDGVDLTKYTQALKTAGVDVLNNNGELKKMDEILNTIGEKWQNISDTQKTALAQTVGGVRQYTTIMALFDNWDVFQENLGVAQGSEGSLEEQAEIYAESWQAAEKRVRASAEAIYQDLLNDDFFIAMNNGFANILGVIDNTIDSLGGLKGVLLLVGATISKLFQNQIGASIDNAIDSIKRLTPKGRESIEKLRKEAIEELRTSAIDEATNEGLAMSTSYKEQATLQDAYLNNVLKMSDAEKNISKSLLEQQQILIENVKLTAQETDETEKRALIISQKLQAKVNTNKKIEDKEDFNETIKNIQNRAVAEGAAQTIINDIAAVDLSKITQVDNKGLKNILKDLKTINSLFNKMESDRLIDFNEAFGEDFQQKLQSFNSLLNDIENSSSETKPDLETLKNTIDELIASIDGAPSSYDFLYSSEDTLGFMENLVKNGIVDDLEQAEKVALSLVDQNYKLGESYVNLEKKQFSLASYTDQVKDKFIDLKNKNTSFGTSLTVVANQMANFGLAISSIKGLFDTWSDSETKTSDKLISTITTLGMVIPTLTTALKAETLAHWENVAAKIAETAANHPYITASIALVGVITAMVIAYENQETELDKVRNKYEEVTKTTQEATNAAADMQQTYSQISETWNSYQNGIDKIEQLTIGTREYTQALHEANQKAWDLIKTQNLKEGTDYEIKTDSLENVVVKLNEDSINRILSESERQANSAQLIANTLQVQSNLAEDQLNKQEALNNAQKAIGNESYIRDYSSGMDASGHQLTGYANEMINASDKLEDVAKLLKENDSKSSTKDLTIDDLRSIYSGANNEELKNILETLQDSDEEISKLVDALNSNTNAVNESLIKEGARAATANRDSKFATLGEGQQSAIVDALTNTEEYQKKYEELLDSYSDDEIHKAYAEYLGAQYVETKDGTSTYLVNGQEKTFSDEAAKMIIANKEALDNLINIESDAYKDLLESAQEMNNNIQLSSSLRNNMLSFKGNYNTNEGDVSAFDPLKINSKDNEFLKEALKESSEERKALNAQMGKEEAEAYLKAYQKAIKDDKLNDETLKTADKATYDSLADGLSVDEDVDTEKLEKLTQYYEDYADSIKEVSDELKNNKYQSKQLAQELERYNHAVEEIADNYENWEKQINEISKKDGILDSEDLETIENVKNAMADMLDLNMSSLSDDFATNTENLKLMKEAADGSEEAYDQLMQKAQQDILAQVKIDRSKWDDSYERLLTELDDINGKKLDDIEIGAKIDDADVIKAMEDLVNKAGMTADQATSFLSSMGFDAEVVVDKTKMNNIVAHNTTPKIGTTEIFGGMTIPTITYDTDPVEGTTEFSAPALKITSAQKSSGGNFKHRGAKSGSSGKSGKSGSGGGSKPQHKNASRKTTDDMKNVSDETERYHVLNNQLEDLEDQLNKISAAKDRAFGKNRIKYINEEIDKYDDLIAKDEEYLKAVEDNLKKDKAAIAAYGASFDQNGTIMNYDALMKAQIDKVNSAYATYNSFIDQYNSLSGEAQEARDKQYEAMKDSQGNYYSGYEDYLEKTYIEPADKNYDNFIKTLEQYEETQDLYKEKSEKLVEDMRAKYDAQLEGVEYEVEVKVMIEDDSLEYLDFLLSKVEDRAHETAEAIAILGNETESFLAKSQINESGIQNIFANHGLTEDDFNAFKNGNQSIIDRIGEMDFTDDEVQTLRDYRSELISMNEELMETRKTIHEKVRDAFNEFNDELDEGIEKIDVYKSITEEYLNIVDLVGQKNLGIANEILNEMGQSVVDQANNKLKSTVDKRDAIEKERNAAQAALDEAKRNGYEEDVKEWEQTLKEMNNALLDAEEEVLSAWEDALTAANEAFEKSVQLSINSLNAALGGLYANADELSEAFDRQKDIDDQHLEDFEQIYQLTKLTREINNAIDDTDNIKGKQELAELLDEINTLEERREQLGENISEYDLEYLQKKLELKRAEIAMEDSQNAKSQVRMSRTYDGTWSYVYTANEEEVAAAEQSYEDKLYEMQRLNADYINTLQDNIVQMQTELTDKLQEIATDESLSIEERQAKMDEVQAYYKEKMDYYSEEMGKVMDNNKELYNVDWQEYSVAHDYKIADDQRYVDSFNETALSTLSGYETMQQFQENFNNAIGAPGQSGSYLDDLDQAFKIWEQNTEETMNNAKTSMEDFSNTMQEEVQILEDKSNEAADNVTEMSETVVNDMQEIIDAVDNWENQYSNTVDAILTKNEALVKSFNAVLQAWAGYKQGTGTNSADETTNPNADAGSGAAGNSGRSGSGDGKPALGDKVTFVSGSYYHDSDGRAPTGRQYKNRQVYITNMNPGAAKPIHISTGTSLGHGDLGWLTKEQLSGYDTGGYTGTWGDDGKLALLHEKELVLNKDDTENFLKIVDMVREISQVIDLNAGAASSYSLTGMFMGGINGSAQSIQQEIHINADFPNATDRDEIKAAFESLAISAAQYANRR